MAEKNENKSDVKQETKAKYEKIMKKYALPKFEEVDYEFEIGTIDDENILRGIRRKMSEKLEMYAKMLEGYIQPDSSFSSMYEVKDFTEDQRNKAMMLFKKLMVFYKEALKLNLNLGEEKDAEFVKSFFEQWQKMKKEIVIVIDIAKLSWSSKDDFKEYNSYLG